MPAADGELRDFVAGFAEPLTRLAALLLAASPADARSTANAERLAIAALARTKRDWRDASAGPESAAVEALLSRLPRRRAPESPPPVDFPDDEPEIAAVKSAVWRAWAALDPRHRAPLLFNDLSAVIRRLDGIELPRSFASSRKLSALISEADERLRFALAQDDATSCPPADVITAWFAPTLADVAARFDAPIDAASRVDAESGRLRWRTVVAVAAVVAVLAGGSVVAANASQPKRTPATAASSSPAAQRPAQQALGTSAGQVVDWPTRGGLRDDTALIAGIRAAYVAAHPDALGQVRVLFVSDTTWFRIAYATSPSPDGAIGSWFYGPVGASALAEGAFRHGADVADDGAIAAAVSDPAGHTVLVVIGPPDTAEVQWTNVESLSAPDPPPGVDDLPIVDGIVVHDVSSTYVPAVRLVVRVGQDVAWSGAAPQVQLAGSAPVAGIPVERGFADAMVLGAAMGLARDWQRTGAFGSSADPRVVWGGVDAVHDVGVVLRMASPLLSDLVVVSWLSDHQRRPQSRAYRVDATSSEAPFAFFYTARDGTRVGVLAPHGSAMAVLVVDGVASAPVPVDGTGFVSMPVSGPSGVSAGHPIEVKLLSASGKPIGHPVVPLEAIAGGDG
ncbi:MAG TPA: hypothetical protein VF218_02705 [Acidothermaceae bacterium]